MASWINLLDCIYPVGSIYCSVSSTSPASIVGGTWSAITEGACLGAAGKNFSVNNYNGSTIMTEAQMPSHSHNPGKNSDGYDVYFQTCRSASTDSIARRYFSTSSNGTQVILSAQTSASDYSSIEDVSATRWSETTGEDQDYYPYQYSVYIWVRTA